MEDKNVSANEFEPNTRLKLTGGICNMRTTSEEVGSTGDSFTPNFAHYASLRAGWIADLLSGEPEPVKRALDFLGLSPAEQGKIMPLIPKMNDRHVSNAVYRKLKAEIDAHHPISHDY